MSIRKNVLVALISNGLPFLITVAALPYTIKYWGLDVVGFLSLLMIIVGYAGVLDLGLSRSLTIITSKLLLDNDFQKINRIFWTTLFFSFILSGLICLLIFCIYLIFPLSNNTEYDQIIRSNALYIILIIPFLIGSSLIIGVLMSYRNFDQVNYVKASVNIFVILSPIIAYHLSLNISGVVRLIFLFRFIAFFIHL